MIRRFLIGEALLEFPLPWRVRLKGITLDGRALRIELDQFPGQFPYGRLGPGLLALPIAAGKPIDLGRFALGTDILLHAVELIDRHIELIRALIADVQKIAVHALARQAHCAHVLTDAVVLVHHIIAHAQLGERGDLFARMRARARALLVRAENIRFRRHIKLDIRILEALAQRDGQNGRFPRRQPLRRLLIKLRGAIKPSQRVLKPFAARHAARQQRDAIILRAQFVHALRQQFHIARVAHGGQGLEFDQLRGPEIVHRAQKTVHQHNGLPIQARDQLVIGQQKLRLFAKGFATLQRHLEMLGKFQRPVFAALTQARGLVQREDGMIHILHDGFRVLVQNFHEGSQRVRMPPMAQGVHHAHIAVFGGNGRGRRCLGRRRFFACLSLFALGGKRERVGQIVALLVRKGEDVLKWRQIEFLFNFPLAVDHGRRALFGNQQLCQPIRRRARLFL